MPVNKFDWTDFQCVVCVARTGSLSAAARELGVNHSTVLRRVSAFEQTTKVQLFFRDSTGYRLSQHGRALLQDIDGFESAMKGLQLRFNDYDTQLEGVLCVTTTHGLFNSRLKGSLFQFARTFPGIKLDLQISDDIKNLAHLESDVAIRPTEEIPDGFFGAHIGKVVFHVYAHKDLARILNEKDAFKEKYWIGYSGPLSSGLLGQLLTNKISEAQQTLKVSSIDAAFEAAKDGVGIALLPEHLVRGNSQLVRISKGNPILERPIHIIARKELQTSRRINTFINFMAKNAK
jgi:DNA-binding transcriptional LysR family regulator